MRSEWEWEDLFLKKYGKPPTFLEMSQFKKNYFGGVYLTTEEHDLVIARQRSMSWKEASDAEKVRDGLIPPSDISP